MPRAPSKVFIIKEKVYLPREEQDQVDLLNWTYESELLSIRRYCRDMYYLPSRTAGGLTQEEVEAQEAEHIRLLSLNDEENRRVAMEREKRRTQERKELELKYKAEFEKQQQLEATLREQAEKMVQVEVERSKTYITKDNLLDAIEQALANPLHYDFAIDKSGRVVTDGKIHPQAFNAGSVPETSECVMLEEKGDIRLKAKKLWIEKKTA